MKVLSLFSGVGGFDLGLEAAGMETVAMCEWDKKAAHVLRRHWPDIPIYGDVSDLTGTQLLADGVLPDLVAFGSPCQDLSVAGKRAGLAGERSGLFHEAIRIIRELQELTNGALPRWVIWENVVGALNSNKGADFGAVLDAMGDLGACFSEWAVLDAQNYGVAQRRRRVFLVSCLDPGAARACPDPLLPVGEGGPRDLAPVRAAWKDATRRPSRSSRGGGAVLIRQREGKPGGGKGPLISHDMSLTLATGNDQTLVQLVDGRRTDDVRVYEEPVQTLQARMGTGGNGVPLAFVKSRRPQSADDDETWVEDAPAPTLNTFDQGDTRTTVAIAYGEGSFGQFVEEKVSTLKRSGGVLGGGSETILKSGSVVRRLLPIECERLMGWPDDWTRWDADGKEQADSHRYKQIGNGVASPVAEWVGREIFAADARRPT